MQEECNPGLVNKSAVQEQLKDGNMEQNLFSYCQYSHVGLLVIGSKNLYVQRLVDKLPREHNWSRFAPIGCD